jgi:hypothetical protein
LESAVSDLIRLKDRLLCHHCERGLFFPITCAIHCSEVVDDGEGVSEGAEDDDIFFCELMPHVAVDDVPEP